MSTNNAVTEVKADIKKFVRTLSSDRSIDINAPFEGDEGLNSVLELYRIVKQNTIKAGKLIKPFSNLEDFKFENGYYTPLEFISYWEEYGTYQDRINAWANKTTACETSDVKRKVKIAKGYVDKRIGASETIDLKMCYPEGYGIKRPSSLQQLNNALQRVLLDADRNAISKFWENLFAKDNQGYVNFGKLVGRGGEAPRPSGDVLPLLSSDGNKFNLFANELIASDISLAGIKNPTFFGSTRLSTYLSAINSYGTVVNGYDPRKSNYIMNAKNVITTPFSINPLDYNNIAVINPENIRVVTFNAFTDDSYQYDSAVEQTRITSPYTGITYDVTIVKSEKCKHEVIIDLDAVMGVFVEPICDDENTPSFKKGVGGAGFIYTAVCSDANLCDLKGVNVGLYSREKIVEPCEVTATGCEKSCTVTISRTEQFINNEPSYVFIATSLYTKGVVTYKWSVNGSSVGTNSDMFTITKADLANGVVGVEIEDSTGCKSEIVTYQDNSCTNDVLMTLNGIDILSNGVIDGNTLTVQLGNLVAGSELSFEIDGSNYEVNYITNGGGLNAIQTPPMPMSISQGNEVFLTLSGVTGVTQGVLNISLNGTCDYDNITRIVFNYTGTTQS